MSEVLESDLSWLIGTLKIRNKDQATVPLSLNWCQKLLIAEVEKAQSEQRPCRLIVLKARQVGISTLSEALLFTKAVTQPNSNCVVVAHDSSSSETLFNMTRFYYETWNLRKYFPHKYATRRQLTIRHPDNEYSNIWVMTAEHTQAGRGRTIHAAHYSEVGFWSDPTEAMLAFNQAMPNRPGTLAIIESTANGRGNWFHNAWEMAEAGETDYVPLFFTWFMHHEYIPCFGWGCVDGSCPTCVDASRIAPENDDEKDLVRMGCDLPHLAWRRWAIPNLCNGSLDQFHQEYPSTAEEAFILSGLPAFPEAQLMEVFEPLSYRRVRLEIDKAHLGKVKPVYSTTGPLRVYKEPSADERWGQYFIGADPSWGVADGDWAAVQVINRHNHEQVAVWHGKVNPIQFADELAKLGAWYNNAVIAVEVDGPGYGTVDRLSEIYPNVWMHRLADRFPGKKNSKIALGFSASWKRKQWAIEKLGELIERGGMILHDRQTLAELRDYAFLGGRGFGEVFGPSGDGHDDLVMSLAICLLCESSEPPLEAYNAPVERPDGLIFGERTELADWVAEQIG